MVELPTGTTNGEVWLFDATFCAVGSNIGTGDRWQSGSGPITTEYRLWDTLGTPYATTDDLLLAESGALFANEAYSSPNCQNAYHNKWYRLASGLGAGVYRLQVTTTAPAGSTTSGANEFGIQVLSNGPAGARVYGLTRIAMYSNVNSATSLFYCCQLEAAHAGKTLEIKLFDPGDVGGNATLRIKKPTATGYANATFSYTSTSSGSGSSGNNVTSLTTASGGSSPFNNHWVTITIVLPTNYGVGGITPPGETEPGWWKMEYTITADGKDTTTWEASIRGSPVHLVIP